MPMWRQWFQQPTQLVVVLLGSACVVAALLLGVVAWRELREIRGIESQVGRTTRIERLGVHIQQMAMARLSHLGVNDPDRLREVGEEIAAIRAEDRFLDPDTGADLDRLASLLTQQTPPTDAAYVAALGLVEEVVVGETLAQRDLLAASQRAATMELLVALGLVAALIVAAGGAAWLLWRRILTPLSDLRLVFDRLAGGDFRAVGLEGVHSVLVPLFTNYNQLVLRLEELETARRARTQSLEEEVRNAAEALLAQQRTLARSERLAAVGELAAGLAHELRNPLAGLQMSLSNLRRDVSDPQLAERLDLALAELTRLTRLLNQHLAAAHHAPEPARPVQLRRLVDDLIRLLRYQVPDHVKLESSVEEGLSCRLPKDRMRQALLNLLWNAVQALGDRPGAVAVRARRDPARGVLVIEVSDDGPGFPPEILHDAGRAFLSHRRGGTGLGLAMVRRFVLDQGGRLELENREPQGALVRLILEG